VLRIADQVNDCKLLLCSMELVTVLVTRPCPTFVPSSFHKLPHRQFHSVTFVFKTKHPALVLVKYYCTLTSGRITSGSVNQLAFSIGQRQ
jgi:hypothetical protein